MCFVFQDWWAISQPGAIVLCQHGKIHGFQRSGVTLWISAELSKIQAFIHLCFVKIKVSSPSGLQSSFGDLTETLGYKPALARQEK